MRDMLHVYSHRDGCMVKAPTWHAWRKYAPLHSRRPCPACSGDGVQQWGIEASPGVKTRWFSQTCRQCEGKGWFLP